MRLSVKKKKEVYDLEKRKSELSFIKQESMQNLVTSNDKDEILRLASTHFDNTQNLIAIQQQ